VVKALLLSLLMIVCVATGDARADERLPAGYVLDIVLEGADAAEKNVIVRDGGELPARLMMPLHAGDVLFLRDPRSALSVELGSGETVQLGGQLTRYRVEGEIATGDSTWGVLTAIADVFAGEGEQAPENMVSKGGAPKVPMSVRGTNFVTARESYWLSWEGGKAPYTVSLSRAGNETILASGIPGTEGAFAVAGPLMPKEKFTLVLRDAEQQKVQIRFTIAEALPDVPSSGGPLVMAARLTAVDDGAWTIEAAQVLVGGSSAAANALAKKIAAGWRLQNPPQ
jgi:hypothetical protein